MTLSSVADAYEIPLWSPFECAVIVTLALEAIQIPQQILASDIVTGSNAPLFRAKNQQLSPKIAWNLLRGAWQKSNYFVMCVYVTWWPCWSAASHHQPIAQLLMPHACYVWIHVTDITSQRHTLEYYMYEYTVQRAAYDKNTIQFRR